MRILLLLTTLLTCFVASAQTISVSPTTGRGSVVPTVTYDPKGKTGCTLSGGTLSGSASSAGSQTLGAVTSKTTNYVISCPATNSTLSIVWTKPTLNTDGSALTDCSGYNVYYDTSSAAVSSATAIPKTSIPSCNTLSYVSPGVAAGTWYVAISTLSTSGGEGNKSNQANITLTGGTPSSATATLTVTPIPLPPSTVTVTEVYAFELRKSPRGQLYASYVGNATLGSQCGEQVFGSYYEVSKRQVQFLRRTSYSGGVLIAKCG